MHGGRLCLSTAGRYNRRILTIADKSLHSFRQPKNGRDMKKFDSDLLLFDKSSLRLSDSVAVIIKTEDNKYLLQHRWNRSGLYFPGFWGLFGGGLKQGESAQEAAKRELHEELGLNVSNIELVMQFDFDFLPLSLSKVGRWFFLAHFSNSEIESINLNEGLDVKAFTATEALNHLRLVYYDAFAIWALESRQRLISAER